MTIRVLSLDFDGCLFNWDYIHAAEQNVIESNKAFLDQIKEDNRRARDLELVYTIIGSNRQSYDADFGNSIRNRTRSCFIEIKEITTYLEATFDPFLLADLDDDLSPGTSYDRALKSMDGEYRGAHGKGVFDETKITLLYIQMHKIANENPGKKIEFDFYDDRMDILTKLSSFYMKSDDFIPENITLRLHHYEGADVTLTETIKGTGVVDADYKGSIDELDDLIQEAEQARLAKMVEALRSPTSFIDLLKDDDKDEGAEEEPSDSFSPALH